MEEVGRRWANACRYKGESKSKDYVEEWDKNRLWCEGLLSYSDQSCGLQSSKEEEINLRYQSWGVPSRYLHIFYTTKFESCAYDYLETFPSDDEVMYNYGAK